MDLKTVSALYTSMSPAHLQQVQVSEMPADLLQRVAHLVKPKACFRNALEVSMDVGFDVVFGAVVIMGTGIAIEHAWVATGGTHYDPTFQYALGKKPGVDVHFELCRLSPSEYLEQMEAFDVERAIDIADLRHSPAHRHLFLTSEEREQLFVKRDQEHWDAMN